MFSFVSMIHLSIYQATRLQRAVYFNTTLAPAPANRYPAAVPDEEIPMVVLIDEGSASASEVLAGAIRDHDRGILIGQTTFGKGTVQTWQQLSNGGGLRMTISRWLTPDKNWVHEEGLTPDYEVALPEFDPEQEFEDTQLQAAIDYLLGEPVMESEPAAEES